MLTTIRAAEDAVLKQDSVAVSNINSTWNAQIQQLKTAVTKAKSASSAAKRVVFLWDIEGTITPLFFVTKILFPYFDENAASFVEQNITAAVIDVAISKRRARVEESGGSGSSASAVDVETEMVEVVKGFLEHVSSGAAASSKDATGAAAPSPVTKQRLDAVLLITDEESSKRAAELRKLLLEDCRHNSSRNLKVPHFKKLQGIVWRSAYETGKIQGHVFSDFPRFLQRCAAPPAAGSDSGSNTLSFSSHMFSSGSVPAQKLLVGFSSAGDLSSKIASYDDTVTAGPKSEASSYEKIIKNSVGRGGGGGGGGDSTSDAVIVFLSDSVVELKAAKTAGMVTVLTVRPQNPPVPEDVDENIFDASVFSCEQVGNAVLSAATFVSGKSELQAVLKDVDKYSSNAGTEERKIF